MTATISTTPAPLFSAGFALNPDPTLGWLRTNDPLHELAPHVGVVTRYDDCRAALVAPGLSAAGRQEERQERSGAATSMLNTDGVEHQRLRRPGQQLLGPAAVAEVLPALHVEVSALLAEVSARRQIDLATEVSEPIATLALISALGLEPGPSRDQLGDLFSRVSVALDPMPTPEGAALGREAVADFERWLTRHLRDYPTGRLGRLVSGDTCQGDVRALAHLAAVGGWAPLAELLTTALELALYDPQHRAAACGPRSSSWCEDVLRWHTPIPFVARRAEVDVPLPSGVISAGTHLLIHIGSSGRDGDQFEDPTVVRGDRAHPRQHLALGAGAHFCLGAPLVRAVLPLAVERFFDELPDSRTAGSLFAWRPGIFPRRPFSTTVLTR